LRDGRIMTAAAGDGGYFEWRHGREEAIMIEIQRILCPVDFSDHSRRALDHAIAIARWYGSRVTVLRVFSPAPVAAMGPGPMVFEPIVLTPGDRDQLLADVKAFADAESAPGITIDAVVREGNVAGEILEQATSMGADLLVIGTHGRSGFERLLLGSVAEKVLRKATCPVMTVPRRLPDVVPAGPVIYKRILCPVDFSESSLRALNYALSLAQEADAQLTVLHVVEHEFQNGGELAGIASNADMTIGGFLREREEGLRRRLQDATAGASEFCSVELLMTHGKPWREVLRVGAERQSDLIVMGVQGRGAADLLFFGSTAQHVVRDASCPVLTLRRG
jgi:nucleotide-binding universal stress UspA family protein